MSRSSRIRLGAAAVAGLAAVAAGCNLLARPSEQEQAARVEQRSRWGTSSVFLTEVIATFTFVIVILASTSAKHMNMLAGLIIGLTLAALHLGFIPVSGNSLNPARSIGPNLFSGSAAISQLWLYIVAPLIGGAIAGVVAKTGVFEKD